MRQIEKNKNHKEAEVAILISDKVEFKSKIFKHDTDGCFLMAKTTIHNESITCMSINVLCDTGVALWSGNYQQMLGDRNRITVVVKDINKTLLIVEDTLSGQNINKDRRPNQKSIR